VIDQKRDRNPALILMAHPQRSSSRTLCLFISSGLRPDWTRKPPWPRHSASPARCTQTGKRTVGFQARRWRAGTAGTEGGCRRAAFRTENSPSGFSPPLWIDGAITAWPGGQVTNSYDDERSGKLSLNLAKSGGTFDRCKHLPPLMPPGSFWP